MRDVSSGDELAEWLASPAAWWVRRSGLAIVLARRGEELLGAQRIASEHERAVSEALLGRWDRALAAGAFREVAEVAAAFASWAAGERPGEEAVDDRAVDLMLRAGALASDGQRLAVLRSRTAETLRDALDRCAVLARVLAIEPAWECGVLALELEDVAARGAGEALIVVLLAGETA
jgi:hypothetical protein